MVCGHSPNYKRQSNTTRWGPYRDCYSGIPRPTNQFYVSTAWGSVRRYTLIDVLEPPRNAYILSVLADTVPVLVPWMFYPLAAGRTSGDNTVPAYYPVGNRDRDNKKPNRAIYDHVYGGEK